MLCSVDQQLVTDSLGQPNVLFLQDRAVQELLDLWRWDQ